MRRVIVGLLITFLFVPLCFGEQRVMEVTAYCKCGMCNSYTRGSWKFLKLDRWNRYVSAGKDKGRRYTGRTASGGRMRAPCPGLFSLDSAKRPWMIPVRALGFPLYGFARPGTIAADTDYYPFGTRIYVPGYGWGRVEDRGGDIKGPNRLDVFFPSHAQTLKWGRRQLQVKIAR